MPRGIALDLGPIDGDRAQADQPRLSRQPEDLDEHVSEGLKVVLAEQADGAKIGPLLPDDGQERQVALTGLGDLPAGEDADAIAIQQQTDHHGRIEGRGPAGLVLVGGMDLGKIELGDDIDQEEDQVILRQLGGRCVGLVGVKFGCPGTIGFGTRRVHDRSQVRMGEDESSSSPHVKVTLAAKPSQSSESATGFMDSLLGRVDNSWVNLRRLGNQLGGILEPFVLVIILS